MKAAIIVAHPDDEVLWCGGEILKHLEWDWFVVSLCRASDSDRRRRFANALRALGAKGQMADLDDGPTQEPLHEFTVQAAILEHLPLENYDVVFTHGPRGEYTRHRRHEECCLAVGRLWQAGQLRTQQMKLFAYQDEDGAALPHVAPDAHEQWVLDADTFSRKYHIITDVYGFDPESWEARAAPATEGFYCVKHVAELAALIRLQTNQSIDL